VALSALILRELKTVAENHLQAPVTHAVITVPAWFREPQRAATVEAAQVAGLHIDRVLNEPTAAAIAHGLHQADRESITVVLDLGGGTFDVTILEMFEGVVEVIASVGDTQLGGEDFTDGLVEHLVETHGVDKFGSAAELRRKVELAKRALTDAESANIITHDETIAVDRATLEAVNQKLLERIRTCITEAMVQAGHSTRQITEVLLVGGATRMPCIHALAESIFERKPLSGIDVDHVVAEGAAVQTALLAKDEAVKDFVVTDVTPHSLGVAVVREHRGTILDDYFSPILHRGTTIPVSRSEPFSTIHHEQDSVTLKVYQGEHRKASFNEHIGQLIVDKLPISKNVEDRCAFQVRFSHDANGLLEVEATVDSTGRKVSTVIERRPGALSEADRDKAIEAMQSLKTPPRELLPNRYALERANRIYSTLRPEHRYVLDDVLLQFEAALERQDPREMEQTRSALNRALDNVAHLTELET
ncbi:MAG: Hsp70 family protein, partial [Myxococcota bacterium]